MNFEKQKVRDVMRRLRRNLAPDEKARAAAAICAQILQTVCPPADTPFCACPHAQQEHQIDFDACAPEAGAQRVKDDCHVTVAVYLASPDEIDLTAAIEGLLARGVTVVAPRWNGAAYDLARLKGPPPAPFKQSAIQTFEHFSRGPMGIWEPKEPDLVAPRDVSVWLVPGLAFTRDGARLGYGGGWYDRFLRDASPNALKLGIAYNFQIADGLPVESHDMRLDNVLMLSPLDAQGPKNV